jgi:hypothetical protein
VPIWPAVIDPADVLIGYNPFADELLVAFGGANRSHYAEPLDASAANYVSLLLDPATDQVVGVMVEQTREVAVTDHPSWRPILDTAPTEPVMRQAGADVRPALAKFVADVRSLARQHTASA